ncbi:alpha/beta hydrolase family protein [Winogradskyella epiphytica]|uniref:Alpha/beta hydrolase family protein n=1 Tax=Winogradskyella epiphytica TaxID=262005 RepID=A0A2V4XIP6_9FLAO|nr:alpha/beta fold hydrolase [Winogradskyella epiphytica]PYE83391.1 alpha/beta hydrolase family protein [Winogradskyella epiphytica]GGW57822.1 alpha/beta hydrolase [Winogradskyella epiphytica]
MHIDKNIVLEREGKKPILIDTFYSRERTNQRIVIFCHGYKGFKDWGSWNIMAEHITNTGFCFVKFNFSHNGGTVDNPIDFPDLDAFGNNNYTKELDDLHDVIEWIQMHFKTNSNIDTNKICLIGHSRGGGIAILKASEDPRITNLITLASVSDFGRRTSTIGDLKEWKETGVKYILNGRTKQKMPHFFQFYEDFKANENRLHIESAAKRINIPWLIIHGSKDTSVNLSEAEELHQWNPNSELKIIENADHVFNTKHPWNDKKLSKELQSVINTITDFIP